MGKPACRAQRPPDLSVCAELRRRERAGADASPGWLVAGSWPKLGACVHALSRQRCSATGKQTCLAWRRTQHQLAVLTRQHACPRQRICQPTNLHCILRPVHGCGHLRHTPAGTTQGMRPCQQAIHGIGHPAVVLHVPIF